MKTQELENDTVKQTVRKRYGRIAEQGGSCGCAPTCCSPNETATKDERVIGSLFCLIGTAVILFGSRGS